MHKGAFSRLRGYDAPGKGKHSHSSCSADRLIRVEDSIGTEEGKEQEVGKVGGREAVFLSCQYTVVIGHMGHGR